MILENINEPADVKKLNNGDLKILAQEMRNALLKKMSICGGHFGSNFGMVEATIALHYVFNSPEDKFVFDVSHQSYGHKMLTGRKEAYLDEEKYREVSGYTCPEESKHDLFNIGHTSTSISLACGLAKARDLKGNKENIIAIIGDGSLSGGEAYEGLDYASELKSNLIIVVNDNQMSISDNHGGLYQNLKYLRDTNGNGECNFFKSLGLDYFYVGEGNNIVSLIDMFSRIKDIDHPTIVHICTLKGKGYTPAIDNKEMWHWRPPFDIETGEMKHVSNEETYDTVVRDFLLTKIKDDPKVVAMVAAVPLSIRFTEKERKEAGKQFIDVGIAEEHAIAMAAGIAKNGGKPIFTTDCTFYQRTYDQIAQEVCINKCPVTLIVRNASVFGMNDMTHLGIFDIPLISNIPNMVYLAPTNKEEYLAMLDWSIEQKEYPVAIRAPKGKLISNNEKVDLDYSDLNKYKVCKNGSEVAVLALGNFYKLGENVVDELYKQCGISATLINPRYITGIDEDLLNKLKKNHKLIITLEDGILDGGFGEKIARFYGDDSIKVKCFGLKKKFIDRYNVNEVLIENGLTVEQIIKDIFLLK